MTLSLKILSGYISATIRCRKLILGSSGVITSSDIADSRVMKKMDDNRGLMIIRDASHKQIQPLTLAYFVVWAISRKP